MEQSKLAPHIAQHYETFEERVVAHMCKAQTMSDRKGIQTDATTQLLAAQEASVKTGNMKFLASGASLLYSYDPLAFSKGGAEWKYTIARMPEQPTQKTPSTAGKKRKAMEGDGGAAVETEDDEEDTQKKASFKKIYSADDTTESASDTY